MVPTIPQVSVVLPVHNGDRHVRRAVESLQKQSLRSFELLAVDDGSEDRTGQILDGLAERDYRITVQHVDRCGIADATNLALARARGRYVYLMGADDWAEPHMLEDMLELAEANRLELVLSGYRLDTYRNNNEFYASEALAFPSTLYLTQQEFRASAWRLFDQGLMQGVSNKLFLRERVDRLGMRLRPSSPDGLSYVLDYLRDVERVGTLEQPYYHRTRELPDTTTSVWDRNLYERTEEEHGWMLDLYRHWGLDGDSAGMEMIRHRYLEDLVSCIENVCQPSCELSRTDKLLQIEQMITSEQAQLAVETTRPRTRMMKAMMLPIKTKNVNLAYREGKLISFARRHNARAFTSLGGAR